MAEADPQIEAQIMSDTTPPAPANSKPKRSIGRLALMFCVPLAIIVAGAIYWYSLQGKVSTDNAYIQQDKVAVSAEISGKLVDVYVRENDQVKAGQLLFRIDPEPYKLQIAEANADIAGAQANLTALSNDSALSGADISAAREEISFAKANFARRSELFKRGFSTKADYDASLHAVSQAEEQLRAAIARQREASARLANGAAVPGENPQIAAAIAKRNVAELNLARTEVRAPSDGRVASSDRLQPGQQVVSGLPLLTLVANGRSYIEANFKETDLAGMKVGQRAEVEIDAYPGLKLKGHVWSIGSGTGSEFSVLPAQNATGNWVKVTQRVPVRIAIDEKSPRQLIAGLSTHVTVFTADGDK